MQPITLIPHQDQGTEADSRELRKSINARVEAYTKAVEQFQAEGGQLTASGAAGTLTPAHVASISNRPGRHIQLLKEESEILTVFVEKWLPMRTRVWQRAHQNLVKQCDELEASVREGLVKLGFDDAAFRQLTGNDCVQCITPDFIGRHPDLLGLRRERDAAFNRIHQDVGQQQMRDRIQQISQEVATCARRLVGAA